MGGKLLKVGKKKSDTLAKKKGKKVMSVVGQNKNQLQLVTYPLL